MWRVCACTTVSRVINTAIGAVTRAKKCGNFHRLKVTWEMGHTRAEPPWADQGTLSLAGLPWASPWLGTSELGTHTHILSALSPAGIKSNPEELLEGGITLEERLGGSCQL